MAVPAHELEAQALALPQHQRTELLLKLLDSIDRRPAGNPAAVETAWVREADRRYQAYLQGEDQAIPAEQAFAELRAEDR
jgi:putative addiction module component (TIGR02574 family)